MHATRLYAGCMASRVHTDRLRWWTFVAVGVVMQRSGASSMSERPEIVWLFDVASDGGGPGAWALALAAIATAIVTVRAAGRPALFGALLLVVSSVYFAFAGVHVYWPRGIFTMVAVAVAFGWPTTRQPPMRAPSPRVRAVGARRPCESAGNATVLSAAALLI